MITILNNISITILTIINISTLQVNNTYNNIETYNILVTPLHIIPEWYFLHNFLILKLIN